VAILFSLHLPPLAWQNSEQLVLTSAIIHSWSFAPAAVVVATVVVVGTGAAVVVVTGTVVVVSAAVVASLSSQRAPLCPVPAQSHLYTPNSAESTHFPAFRHTDTSASHSFTLSDPTSATSSIAHHQSLPAFNNPNPICTPVDPSGTARVRVICSDSRSPL
jgi:hypothetical protein